MVVCALCTDTPGFMTQQPSSPDRFSQLAHDLAVLAREFADRRWTPATSSNFSVRLGPTECAVTISGRDKTQLTADDLMRVDLQGNPMADYGSARPSAEAGLHLSLYRRLPEVGAVLHVHSPNSVLTTRLRPGAECIDLAGYELLKAFRGITTHESRLSVPILANSQDIDTLAGRADMVLAALETQPCWAYLIRDHGVYAWGRDLAEAMRHLEALDYLLGIELELSRLTGQEPGP